jgi:hypothetical protein
MNVDIDLTVIPDEVEEIDSADSAMAQIVADKRGIDMLSNLDQLARADAKPEKKRHANKRAKSGSGTGLHSDRLSNFFMHFAYILMLYLPHNSWFALYSQGTVEVGKNNQKGARKISRHESR